MNLRKLYFLLLIIPLMFFYQACSEDDSPTQPTPTVSESETLLKFLEGTDGGFINTTCPQMISATDVNTGILTGADQYIIDIRAAADFAAGHIQGAVNVALKDIITHYETNNLQSKATVVIACYSGQTAGYAASLLQLLGYSNVKDLKWGMCSWNDVTANAWKNTIANGNSRAAQFVTTASPSKGAVVDLPTIATGQTTGEGILRARINALLAAADPFGDAKIDHNGVYANLTGHYIINYWTAAHYATGHIDGSIQYTPKADLKLDTFIKTLPTNKPVVVYCYTGQTSAHVAAFLRLLGYDAKTLLFGVNAMNYDNMPASQFTLGEIKNFPLVQ